MQLSAKEAGVGGRGGVSVGRARGRERWPLGGLGLSYHRGIMEEPCLNHARPSLSLPALEQG